MFLPHGKAETGDVRVRTHDLEMQVCFQVVWADWSSPHAAWVWRLWIQDLDSRQGVLNLLSSSTPLKWLVYGFFAVCLVGLYVCGRGVVTVFVHAPEGQLQVLFLRYYTPCLSRGQASRWSGTYQFDYVDWPTNSKEPASHFMESMPLRVAIFHGFWESSCLSNNLLDEPCPQACFGFSIMFPPPRFQRPTDSLRCFVTWEEGEAADPFLYLGYGKQWYQPSSHAILTNPATAKVRGHCRVGYLC